MKKTLLMILLCYTGHCFAQTSAPDLQQYAGKRLLYIILPAIEDTSLNNQLLRFRQQYKDTMPVIALCPAVSRQLEEAGVVFTAGFPRTGTKDPRQSVLEWLTGRMPSITGSKYFISEDGRLYAHLGPDIPLDLPLVRGIVLAAVPKSHIDTIPH
ncbi:hypothetical protein [Chitinophaga solisilvae]|uniref:hypothetical protein n=1 Tax=Chitinophaga solisilvae TaxID=1233460 RepID=UPI00136FE44A|nr:hypothetical protein [Chitinophaga solisilvae]